MKAKIGKQLQVVIEGDPPWPESSFKLVWRRVLTPLVKSPRKDLVHIIKQQILQNCGHGTPL